GITRWYGSKSARSIRRTAGRKTPTITRMPAWKFRCSAMKLRITAPISRSPMISLASRKSARCHERCFDRPNRVGLGLGGCGSRFLLQEFPETGFRGALAALVFVGAGWVRPARGAFPAGRGNSNFIAAVRYGIPIPVVPGHANRVRVARERIPGGQHRVAFRDSVAFCGAGLWRRAGSHLAGHAGGVLPRCLLYWFGRLDVVDRSAAAAERGVHVVANRAARRAQQLWRFA